MIRRVLETALYCEDLPRQAAFYRDVLGLPELVTDDRLVALDAGGQTVLLLFDRRATATAMILPDGRGIIPPHQGSGPQHLALAIDVADLGTLRQRLADAGVPIESTVQWPRGGTSIYCRDPEGHSLEFATPGLWPTW